MKVYLTGSSPSIQVPFREIALTSGERIRLYDTGGPHTDPDFTADLKQGLPPACAHGSRNDVRRARPYSRAHDYRFDHVHRSPPPHYRGMGGRLRLRSSPLPPDRIPRLLPFPENAV